MIRNIEYRTIYDSRGVETIEVDVTTEGGFGRAAAPFGAPGSRGEFEASAYGDKGLGRALEIVKGRIIPGLIGMNALNQKEIDRFLKTIDGTANYDRIGGNTSSALSIACMKAAANSLRVPLFQVIKEDGGWTLPYPLGNIIGGGAHSMGPAPDMQEHLVVATGAKSVREAVALNLKVHDEVGKLLEEGNFGFTGGTDDENAWTADLNDVKSLDILTEASARISHATGVEIRLGLDLAADRLWNSAKKVYQYQREGIERTPGEQVEYLSQLIEKYQLLYVEDGFESNDYDSFARLNKKYGDKCYICADDVYASNPQRTLVGIKKNSANAMIIKPNQVGTVTETRCTVDLAREHGLQVILSHRSGETLDDSIAHMAIAWNALMIKTGVKGGERLAKLNELIRIEDQCREIRLRKW